MKNAQGFTVHLKHKGRYMKIVMIGSGNVATVLGNRLLQAGHTIVQVMGRNIAQTEHLAIQLDAQAVHDWKSIKRGMDIYLVAISDTAIQTLSEHLQLEDEIVVHTAGAVMKEVLSPISSRYGVMYPLQSLRKNKIGVQDIPFMVDGSDEKTRKKIQKLALTISDKVTVSNDIQRLRMHLAAVIVNNFVNNLYVLAESYCQQYDLDFKQLLPLIRETVKRLPNQSPQQLQTGPAVRHDAATIEKHLSLLQDNPKLQEIYALLTSSIQQVHPKQI
jgi:predicted short-subunit dehydrogenase-like oxidoreductase (DUF2520 family)